MFFQILDNSLLRAILFMLSLGEKTLALYNIPQYSSLPLKNKKAFFLVLHIMLSFVQYRH